LLSPELNGKRHEILIEAVPGASRAAAVPDARVTPSYHIQMLQQAAQSRGVELSVFSVSGPEERQAPGAKGINFLKSPLFSLPGTHNFRIGYGTDRNGEPAGDVPVPESAEAGALAAYGPRRPSY